MLRWYIVRDDSLRQEDNSEWQIEWAKNWKRHRICMFLTDLEQAYHPQKEPMLAPYLILLLLHLIFQPWSFICVNSSNCPFTVWLTLFFITVLPVYLIFLGFAFLFIEMVLKDYILKSHTETYPQKKIWVKMVMFCLRNWCLKIHCGNCQLSAANFDLELWSIYIQLRVEIRREDSYGLGKFIHIKRRAFH